MTKTLAQLSNELRAGATSAEQILDECLANIDNPNGESERVVLSVDREMARAAAKAADLRLMAKLPSGPLTGIPISVKDLCDVAGEVTTAGSTILDSASPAKTDALIIARLRAAGAMFVGRTNMSEFAYSGVGINPHYDTPRNPYDRETGRIPGGSSSGAAVSVTDGMAAIGIGTDTGGSCRIPAALCGIVGYKPTAKRVPLDGIFPLSSSLDSVGSLGHSVSCVALLDAIMAGEAIPDLEPYPIIGMRLCLPENVVLNDIDEEVNTHFFAAVSALEKAGANIDRVHIDTFDELPSMVEKGGMVAAEALAVHSERLAQHGDEFDQRVRMRISIAKEQSAVDYIRLTERRQALQAQFRQETRQYDALIMPTTPKVAPPIAALAEDDDFFRINGLMLRNTAIANVLDLCAITLPCQPAGSLPVGLSLVGKHMDDHRLFEMALTVERLNDGTVER